MGQGQNEQGQRGDQERNGDQNDCHFQIENVFEHMVGDEECGNFVSYGGEEMMDVQRITSFFVMRDLFLFRLIWVELLNEFGFGCRYLYM